MVNFICTFRKPLVTLSAAIGNRRLSVCRHNNAWRDDLGLVRPGNIFQGTRRTGCHALRIAAAESTLGRFCRLTIDRSGQGSHCPRASLHTDAASYTFGNVYDPGVDRGDDLNGIVRAGQLTWHRMRALAACILDGTEVTPEPVSPHEPLTPLQGARIIVSAYFDAGNRGL